MALSGVYTVCLMVFFHFYGKPKLLILNWGLILRKLNIILINCQMDQMDMYKVH